jgi:peptidyl-prolyl cis-trans isomerase A (cyclophilin A)
VVKGFMAQFGIPGDPEISAAWAKANIPDDPVVESNRRGYVTFAKAGPDSRSTQLFISYVDKNSRLDKDGFPPIGKVVQGMYVVDTLCGDYGDAPPGGRGPSQELIRSGGNQYLRERFPKLDYIKRATLLGQ